MKIRRVSYGTPGLCICRSRVWQSTHDYDEIIQIGITFATIINIWDLSFYDSTIWIFHHLSKH